MNSRAFKAKLILKGYSPTKLIETLKKQEIDLSLTSYYRKLKGESEFSRKEIKEISNLLELSEQEMLDIFFNE